MKNNTIEIGDIVTHKQDLANRIKCFGTVIEIKGIECLVMWSSESSPISWHDYDKLKLIKNTAI